MRIRKPTWKLVRTRGQKYQIVETAVDQKPRENWIIANFKLVASKRKLSSHHSLMHSTVPSRKKISQDLVLKKKLKTLKDLLDGGLIDKLEYGKKKENLLNKHL